MHRSRLNLDNPGFVIDIHDLGRRPGDTLSYSDTFSAPAELGTGMITVPENSSIEMDLTLSSVVEGVFVTGNATALLQGHCSRCLEPVEYTDVFELQELYFWPQKQDEADEDALFVVDETIDLEPILRDGVVLTLPFAPICQDDCAGLCQECGINLNQEPEHNHGTQVDARWEKLVDLFGENTDGDPVNP